MPHYFRIQPSGLGLSHRSETSSGELDRGLHVFWLLHQVRRPDVPAEDYGNEVVILYAPRSWANGDVEGVSVDGSSARVVARYPLSRFLGLTRDMDGDMDADDVVAAIRKKRRRRR